MRHGEEKQAIGVRQAGECMFLCMWGCSSFEFVQNGNV